MGDILLDKILSIIDPCDYCNNKYGCNHNITFRGCGLENLEKMVEIYHQNMDALLHNASKNENKLEQIKNDLIKVIEINKRK